MATLEQVESLLVDLNARLEQTPGLTEEQVRGIVRDVLATQEQDTTGAVGRIGDAAAHPALVGSKFARWGCSLADIEFLYDIQSALRGVPRKDGGVYGGPSEELTRAFQEISEAYYLPTEQVRDMDRQAIDNLFPRVPKAGFLNRVLGRTELLDPQGYERAIRAMDTAETGYGSQLVGAQYVGDLWAAARPESRIFPLFHSFEMTAPTAYLPIEADLPEMYFVGENTSSTASDYSTDGVGSNRVQVDAKKFIINMMWSGEMEEDSIIPYLRFLRGQAALSLAHYSDSLVINGDTTNAATGNINEDNADPTDTQHWLAFDGIRHAALVDNTGNANDIAGALEARQLLDLKVDMAQANTYAPMHWGFPTMPSDLVYVPDFATYAKMLDFDEVTTVDKYGPQATVLTGELGRIYGHPVIPSQVVKLTAADGKVDTADDGTKGQVVAFNRRGFVVGWRRRVQVEVERLPRRDQTGLILSLRLGFGRYSATGAVSGIEAAAVAYDITV